MLSKRPLGSKKALGSASASQIAKAKASGAVTTEQRTGNARNHSAHLAKLEDSNDVFAHKTVDRALSQAIAQARCAKKLTQAQLATQINEPPQTIKEYESGKAIPNPNVLNKLDRALGIHLPRGKKR